MLAPALAWLLAASAAAAPLEAPGANFKVEVVETSAAPGRTDYLLLRPSPASELTILTLAPIFSGLDSGKLRTLNSWL